MSEKRTNRNQNRSQGASFAMRITTNSHIAIVLLPSTTIGPQPVRIPVTGHNLNLEIAVVNANYAILHGLRAEVTERAPLEYDGVATVPQPGPAGSAADDLAEARRRGLEKYRPLQVPHLEILLDTEPPTIRPALNADGTPARECPPFPLLLQKGTHLKLILAPLTDDRRHVFWRLLIDVEWEGNLKATSRDLHITAETTYRIFYPDGREPESVPAHELAPHWHTAFPPRDAKS
jgi:hypothetical protein